MKTFDQVWKEKQFLERQQRKLIKEHKISEAQTVEAQLRALRWVLS